MQTVIDENLIHYNILGSGNNNEILILHGWGQSSKDWEYIAQKLSTKYAVTTLDLPGFGNSPLSQVVFSTKKYADLVKSFVEKLNLKDVILIGHSLGGKIAVEVVSENNIRFKKLFLISPSGIDKKSFGVVIKTLVVKILKLLLFWAPERMKNKYIKIFASRDYLNAGNLKTTLKTLVNEKVINQARKVTLPTVIIWGEKDEEVNVTTSKYLKSLIKGSTLRVLWGERHSVNIENPDKLYSVLSDYL